MLKAQERCIPWVAFETGPNRPTATEVEEEVGDQGELDNMPNEKGQQVDIHLADVAQPLTPAASHVGGRKRDEVNLSE